jgi:deoxyribodipyrimidine photo-lyase
MFNLFLFHRDLRLVDHRPLQQCLSYKLPVIPLFVLEKPQVDPKVPIRSIKSLACLFQSLEELDQEFRSHYQSNLCIMYGEIEKVLSNLLQKKKLHTIVETRDYTPFAVKRQEKIAGWCKKNNLHHVLVEDLYFFPPGTIRNQSGKIYQKFTPFYNIISKKEIPKPTGRVRGGKFHSFETNSLTDIYKQLNPHQPDWKKEQRKYQGGRKEGLTLLQNLPLDYDVSKSLEKSGLSVHHHYGTVSVRESYERASQLIQRKHAKLYEFQRQLFWRDFYGNLMAFFKDLYHTDPIQFQAPKPLSGKKKLILEKWCQGTTQIPIIDAAMNQLNTEGFMPNRMRMIVASWLIKDMKIPWRHGEQYFANHLLDYDLTQNMMNWIWVASVLPFASAPFRRFSTENVLSHDHPYLKKWYSKSSLKKK